MQGERGSYEIKAASHRRGSCDEQRPRRNMKMDELRKIYKGPERQWNPYNISGSINSGISFMENQVSDMADNLEKFPWKAEEKDRDREMGQA